MHCHVESVTNPYISRLDLVIYNAQLLKHEMFTVCFLDGCTNNFVIIWKRKFWNISWNSEKWSMWYKKIVVFQQFGFYFLKKANTHTHTHTHIYIFMDTHCILYMWIILYYKSQHSIMYLLFYCNMKCESIGLLQELTKNETLYYYVHHCWLATIAN